MKNGIQKIIVTTLFLGATAFMISWASSDSSTVVAKMGDTEFKTEDLRAILDTLEPKDQEALSKNKAALNQILKLQLTQRLVLKEAQGKGWDKRSDIASKIEQARRAIVVENYVKSVSVPPETFPSAAELKSFYETNKEALRVPKQYRLAQIFILTKSDDDKIRQQLDGVRRKPESFSASAQELSEDKASAARGGEVGWVLENQIQPEIRPYLQSIQKNGITEPFKLSDGWHLIKVMDSKDSYIPSLEESKNYLTQQMRTEKTKANSQQYMNKIIQSNPVTINEIALNQQIEQLTKSK